VAAASTSGGMETVAKKPTSSIFRRGRSCSTMIAALRHCPLSLGLLVTSNTVFEQLRRCNFLFNEKFVVRRKA